MFTQLFRFESERRTLRTGIAAGVLALLLTACGGGDDPVTVQSVSVSPSTASVEIGATTQLAASPLDGNGNLMTGRAVTWSTSNSSTATVTSSGLVTGVANGTAQITATVDGKSGNATVTVNAPGVATITITPTTPALAERDTVRFRATTRLANGTEVTGRTVTWTSSTVATATINSSGLLTAVAAGTTTVTATSEGRTATTLVTVVREACDISRAVPLTSGVLVNGSLVAADCDGVDGDDTVYDIYKFTLATQATLDIQMKSTAFDAYIFLVQRTNDSTFVIASNDDDTTSVAGTTDARLTGLLPAGEYYVLANGFFVGAGGVFVRALGPYTLLYTSPFTFPAASAAMDRSNPVSPKLTRVRGIEAAKLRQQFRRP
jgi:uncharacterized protein YjdB